MNYEFVAVPDYECSGVVEHYTKVSMLVSSDAFVPIAVCSVIVNKKTGNVQHQAKIDHLDGKHVRIAMFGYGKGVKSYCTLDQIANDYANLTDNEKQNLRVCFSGLEHSVAMAVRKMPALNGMARIDLMHYADQTRKGYWEIEHGEYENSVLPPTSAPAIEDAPAEDTQENAPAVEEAAPIARNTKKVARLVFANGLTEFFNGNIYDVDEDNRIALNGKIYYAVKNDNGEIRFLDANRFQIVDQFTEPPIA